MSLIEDIRALPIEVTNGRNTVQITEELNKTRPFKLVSTLIGTGTILAKFSGLGGQFLDTLDALGATDRDIYWLLHGNILRGACDIGDPATRAGLVKLRDNLPAFTAGINALLSMAQIPDPINEFEVRKACWSDDGRWVV